MNLLILTARLVDDFAHYIIFINLFMSRVPDKNEAFVQK